MSYLKTICVFQSIGMKMCMLVGGGARNNHLAFLKAQVLQSLPYVSTGALGF